MPRQKGTLSVDQFVGGFHTESSPLNSPPNTSSDELNVELNPNGSRYQRQGFDAEEDYVSVNTGVPLDPSKNLGRNQYRWVNPGGFPDKQILVVQIGNYLGFHEITESALSSSTLYSTTFSNAIYNNRFGFSVVDGTLVVVTGLKEVSVFQYDGASVTESSETLLIRDLFGVEDQVAGVGDLLDPENLQYRPVFPLSVEHLYNLRNQTWALPRPQRGGPGDLEDPIWAFLAQTILLPNYSTNHYPSNADSVVPYLLADPSILVNKTLERYQQTDSARTIPSNVRAPTGYFIIDALERGPSRMEALNKLYADNPTLRIPYGQALSEDRTPGGASIISQYAGRIWYGGFSASVENGDSHSPRMSSYILFTKIIQSPSDLNKCYQEGDPTSQDPDLTDADGGFIKIDGAYNIVGMLPIGESLFIFAENGVWRIAGVDSAVFSATSYSVNKVSYYGCISSTSVVEIDNNAFYWGDEGIYRLYQQPKTISWEVEDVTSQTIKSFYEGITDTERSNCVGYYDYRTYSVRWIYCKALDSRQEAKELIFNTKFGSFTKNSIDPKTYSYGPISVCGGRQIQNLLKPLVTVGGVQVTVGGSAVTLGEEDISLFPSESLYCVILGITGTLTYTFGGYKSSSHTDWDRLGAEDNLPSCYIVTSAQSAPDSRQRKDVPYITLHMPYEEDGVSCLVHSQWGWSNDVESRRWSTPREAYRPTVRSPYFDIVTSRHRIRGAGQAVSFKFESDGVSPLKLFGWSHNIGITQKE